MFSFWYPSSFERWEEFLKKFDIPARDVEVTVTWSEPAGLDRLEWVRHTQKGSAARLAVWAQKHVEFWVSSAFVPLTVEKMEYKTGDVHQGW